MFSMAMLFAELFLGLALIAPTAASRGKVAAKPRTPLERTNERCVDIPPLWKRSI